MSERFRSEPATDGVSRNYLELAGTGVAVVYIDVPEGARMLRPRQSEDEVEPGIWIERDWHGQVVSVRVMAARAVSTYREE